MSRLMPDPLEEKVNAMTIREMRYRIDELRSHGLDTDYILNPCRPNVMRWKELVLIATRLSRIAEELDKQAE